MRDWIGSVLLLPGHFLSCISALIFWLQYPKFPLNKCLVPKFSSCGMWCMYHRSDQFAFFNLFWIGSEIHRGFPKTIGFMETTGKVMVSFPWDCWIGRHRLEQLITFAQEAKSLLKSGIRPWKQRAREKHVLGDIIWVSASSNTWTQYTLDFLCESVSGSVLSLLCLFFLPLGLSFITWNQEAWWMQSWVICWRKCIKLYAKSRLKFRYPSF